MHRKTAQLMTAILATATAACAGSGVAGNVRSAAETITAADVHDRIAFLASDELRGRDTPSPGLDTAAHWIAERLASFGVEPGADGRWLQRYPYPSVALDPGQALFRVAGGATHTFAYGEDYYVRPGVTPEEPVGLVYMGEDLMSDADAVRGRAALVRLTGLAEPGRRGWRLSQRARAIASRAMASGAEAGAAALVFVLDPRVHPSELDSLARAAERPSRRFGGAGRDAPAAFYAGYDAALRMFRMAGLDGGAILARGHLTGPVPLEGVTVRLNAPLRVVDDASPPNVVGVVRGSDPVLRDRYVVVTAHMDHLGVGRPDETGDSIYNGADDDASGTAVLLEVAEALAGLEPKPRRSVLFVAVSGEEKGLLGSRWFTENPTVPLESMVGNVNIDMVGRNAPDSIVVIGQEHSSLGPLVNRIATANPELGLTVSEDIWPEQRFFFRSDHFNFARAEIPALFFFAGTHEDYHRPGDEVDEIDTDKVARVGRLVFYLTHAMADGEAPPAWDPEGLETVRAMTAR